VRQERGEHASRTELPDRPRALGVTAAWWSGERRGLVSERGEGVFGRYGRVRAFGSFDKFVCSSEMTLLRGVERQCVFENPRFLSHGERRRGA